MKQVWAFVCVGLLTTSFILPGSAEAQSGRTQVQEGNRLYSEGLYAEAYEKYLEALSEAPGSPLIRFNEGNALFQNGDIERAMESYQAALESGDPRLESAAWYNLGNALYQAQQLDESLEAFKQALRANPADLDAKHNLERVLEQMQEQEQQDQDDQQQDENQDPENQDQRDEDSEQDPNQPPQEDQSDSSESDDPPEEDQQGEGPQPQEGEMTPEEAQRLLQAIQEDPGDVNRKPQAAQGRIPRKKW